MGTRGYFAIVYKGKVYLAYCHFDAYPERPGMGWTLVKEIQWGNLETWKRALDNIKLAEGKPTEEDKKALYRYRDLTVSSQSEDDWYCLTRKCQGSIAKTLQSGYFKGDIKPFVEEDIKEELSSRAWSYIIDFDKNEFRTFQGAEVHFWRFPLDAIPLGTFGEASIAAFNRISDGDEFTYHDNSIEVVEAYKRFFEEEKAKKKEEKSSEKGGTTTGDADAAEKTTSDNNRCEKSSDENPSDAKNQKP